MHNANPWQKQELVSQQQEDGHRECSRVFAGARPTEIDFGRESTVAEVAALCCRTKRREGFPVSRAFFHGVIVTALGYLYLQMKILAQVR